MPYTFYILYSATVDKFYVGYTGDAVAERLRRHNTNHKGFTGRVPDWEVGHLDAYDLKLEKYFRQSKPVAQLSQATCT